MKTKFFVVAENNTQFFFSIEEKAAEKANALNKNYEIQSVNEDIFNNMINDCIFIDTLEFLEKQGNQKSIEVDVLEEEQEILTDENNGIDLKEVLKEINFLKNKLSIFEEERTDLISTVKNLEKENLKLKTKKVFDLETAKKLYDKKQELLKNRSIFENALDNSNTALNEMKNIIDFDENKSYRLTLNVLDHSEQEAGTLFGISNNLVIMEVLNHINLKVNEKINFINSEVHEIESKFN